MLDSKALTKIQSIILIAVIVIAAIGGGVAYFLLNQSSLSSEAIKIGFLADLDNRIGKKAWQGAVLAAEQLNAEGGILGRKVELISEDHDLETDQNMIKVSEALNRLIAVHKVDFIIGQVNGEAGLVSQDIIADHKKILIAFLGTSEELTQRVLDDYEKYKYYFKVWALNSTATFQGMIDSLLLLRENTGFNKVGYLAEDLKWNKEIREGFDYLLPEVYGFELVYKQTIPVEVLDYSSYLAGAEAAGVEVLMPLIWMGNGIPLVNEWYDRQSPMLIYGGVLAGVGGPDSWEVTDGKCEHIITPASALKIGYPLTSKSFSTLDAYVNRWNEDPSTATCSAYDAIRFILPDAIERAGTIETNAVIEALEQTKIETTLARNFVFTESHDVMMGENPNDPEGDYMLILLAQLQNENQVIVYPKKIMAEAGASYTFPDWSGPWDSID